MKLCNYLSFTILVYIFAIGCCYGDEDSSLLDQPLLPSYSNNDGIYFNPLLLSEEDGFDGLLNSTATLDEQKGILDYIEFLSSDVEKLQAEPMLMQILEGDYPLEIQIRAARPLMFYGSTEYIKESAKSTFLELLSNNLDVILRKEIDPYKNDYFDSAEYIYLFPALAEVGADAISVLEDIVEGGLSGSVTTENLEMRVKVKELAKIALNIILSDEEIAQEDRSLLTSLRDKFSLHVSGSETLDMDRFGDNRTSLTDLNPEATDGVMDLELSSIISDIDLENIMSYIYSFSQIGSREVGSTGHAEARDNIIRFLNILGLEPEIDSFFVEEEEYRNIVVRFQGISNSDKKVVLSAHYDTAGSGVEDNASGISVILEIARLLSDSSAAFDNTIEIVFFDGEEVGLYGSSHYAFNSYQNKEEIIADINLDCVGLDFDGAIEFESVIVDDGSDATIDFLDSLKLALNSTDLEVYGYVYNVSQPDHSRLGNFDGLRDYVGSWDLWDNEMPPWQSDHIPFLALGYNGINIEGETELIPYINSEFDLMPIYTDLTFFEKITQTTLSIIFELASI